MPAGFKFLVTSWCHILPKIGEVESRRVEKLPVAAIVLNIPAALPESPNNSASSLNRFVATLFASMAITAVGLFGADRELGTWKFNPAKSTPSNLKSRTEVIEATPDGWMKVTRTELRADGINRIFSFTFKYDGKDYPVTGGTFDTIAQERLDANTTTFKVKKTGSQYQAAGRFTVSRDGKIRTQLDKGTGLDGKPFELTRVYDKQ